MRKKKECPYCYKPYTIFDRPTCTCKRQMDRMQFLKEIADKKRQFNMPSINKDSDKEITEGAKKLDNDLKYY